MDDQTALLREEFSRLVRKTTELKVTLDRAEGKIQGVPHYSVIEEAAHEVGREISRMVQARHLAEVVADFPEFARCPKCETRCKLDHKKRTVLSGDGSVELPELVGHCPCCRKDFFPATGNTGI